jgi:DNA polymerase-3 subunit epsilon
MSGYITLDLETTGLQPDKDAILEIGAIKVVEGRIVGTYATFVDPKREVPARITEITGITGDMVQGEPGIETALPRLLEFCEDLPLLGHNLIFDYSFVKYGAAAQGLPFEREGVDTLTISRKVLPDLESRSLQYLRKYYGIPQDKAHRALDDARTTYLLFERLREEFGQTHPEAFQCCPLVCKVKKPAPITNAQKGYLRDLIKYHRIELDAEIDKLSKSDASKIIDGILSTHGRIKR